MSGEKLRVLDLFSAAAGGWSLGLHRAGFTTVAACEVVEWRRALYAENNPGVRLYDDVRTLTAERLRSDLGFVPDIVVGSPPCQDISSANTKGKGVDGERSGLFFEAVRIIGECRPRWFALENSANLRSKGADRVLAALEAQRYATEPCVVGAGDGRQVAGVGANHERARAWLIGFDPDQIQQGPIGGLLGWSRALDEGGAIADPDGAGWAARWSGWRRGLDLPLSDDLEHTSGVGRQGGRSWGSGSDGDGAPSTAPSDAGDATGDGRRSGRPRRRALAVEGLPVEARGDADEPANADQARRQAGYVVAGLGASQGPESRGLARPPADGSHANDEGQPNGAEHVEVGGGSSAGDDATGPWSEWNGGLAGHLRVDDGLSAWVAGTRVAVGGPRGTAAASLLVEAYGDAVLPQIPEAIGRAILRTERALAAIYGAAA